jgi:hypothetical protein
MSYENAPFRIGRISGGVTYVLTCVWLENPLVNPESQNSEMIGSTSSSSLRVGELD